MPDIEKPRFARALFALCHPGLETQAQSTPEGVSEELWQWMQNPLDPVAPPDKLLEELGCDGTRLRKDRVHVWYCQAGSDALEIALQYLLKPPAYACAQLQLNVDRAALPNPILRILSPDEKEALRKAALGKRAAKKNPATEQLAASDAQTQEPSQEPDDAAIPGKAQAQDGKGSRRKPTPKETLLGTWIVLEGGARADGQTPDGAAAPGALQLCEIEKLLKDAFPPKPDEWAPKLMPKVPMLDKALHDKLEAYGQWPATGLRKKLEDASDDPSDLATHLMALRSETQRVVGERADLKKAQISAWLKDADKLHAARARRILLDLGLAAEIARPDRWLLDSDTIHYWLLGKEKQRHLEAVMNVLQSSLTKATLIVDNHAGKRQYGLLKVPDQSRHRTAWILLEALPFENEAGEPVTLRQCFDGRVQEIRDSDDSIPKLLRLKRRAVSAEAELYVDAAEQLIELRGMKVAEVADAAGLEHRTHLYQWLGKTPDGGGLSAEQVRKILEAIGLRGHRLACDQVHVWEWRGYTPRAERLLELIQPVHQAAAEIVVDNQQKPTLMLLKIGHQAWGKEAWVEEDSGKEDDLRKAWVQVNLSDAAGSAAENAVQDWCSLLQVPRASVKEDGDLRSKVNEHVAKLHKRFQGQAPSADPDDLDQDLLLFLKQVGEERTRLLTSTLKIPFKARHDSTALRSALQAGVKALDANVLQPHLNVLAKVLATMAEKSKAEQSKADRLLLLLSALQAAWKAFDADALQAAHLQVLADSFAKMAQNPKVSWQIPQFECELPPKSGNSGVPDFDDMDDDIPF